MEEHAAAAVAEACGESEGTAHLASGMMAFSLVIWLTAGHALSARSRYLGDGSAAALTGLALGLCLLAARAASLLTPAATAALLTFDASSFFVVYLPPIILHAGLSVRKKAFFEHVGVIAALGIGGTYFAFGFVAALLWWLAGRGAGGGGGGAGAAVDAPSFSLLPPHLRLSLGDCLALGAIFAATDSVAVLQVLDPSRAPLLFSLVFGEGVVNDATTVALLRTVAALRPADEPDVGPLALLSMGASFCGLFAASLVLGVAAGLGCALLLKKTRPLPSSPAAVGVVAAASYCAYALADGASLSGIVSLFCAAVAISHYGLPSLGREQRGAVLGACEAASFLAEGAVFVFVGLDALDPRTWARAEAGPAAALALAILSATLLARACFLFPVLRVANWLVLKKDEEERRKERRGELTATGDASEAEREGGGEFGGSLEREQQQRLSDSPSPSASSSPSSLASKLLGRGEMVVAWWAGAARGAVSVALVFFYYSPRLKGAGGSSGGESWEDERVSTLVAATLAVVIFSTVGCGAATKPLLDRMLGASPSPSHHSEPSSPEASPAGGGEGERGGEATDGRGGGFPFPPRGHGYTHADVNAAAAAFAAQMQQRQRSASGSGGEREGSQHRKQLELSSLTLKGGLDGGARGKKGAPPLFDPDFSPPDSGTGGGGDLLPRRRTSSGSGGVGVGGAEPPAPSPPPSSQRELVSTTVFPSPPSAPPPPPFPPLSTTQQRPPQLPLRASASSPMLGGGSSPSHQQQQNRPRPSFLRQAATSAAAVAAESRAAAHEADSFGEWWASFDERVMRPVFTAPAASSSPSTPTAGGSGGHGGAATVAGRPPRPPTTAGARQQQQPRQQQPPPPLVTAATEAPLVLQLYASAPPAAQEQRGQDREAARATEGEEGREQRQQ